MQDAAALGQWMREAGAAREAGEFGRAELLFREIVGRNPRDAGAWNVLAVIACRSARPQEAVEHARRAHELERRHPEYLNTLGVAHGEAHSPKPNRRPAARGSSRPRAPTSPTISAACSIAWGARPRRCLCSKRLR